MSELDRGRREFFLQILNRAGEGGNGMQSFITTTELDMFDTVKDGVNIIRI